MSYQTANFVLPLIAPAQAQKHVTHNEAVLRLDALSQIALAGLEAETPPADAPEGEVWALGNAPTGAWAGQGGKLALRLGGGWVFTAPKAGWIGVAGGVIHVHDGASWTAPEVASLGVNANADASRPLTVSGDGTLLTHAGGDHRLTVNNAGAGTTASLVFQSNWSGRAEMGLAGEDAFSVKVSPDGSGWTTALRLDPATGAATGAAVQETPADIRAGRLMRADWGYGPGNLVGAVSHDGTTPTGAVIERGGSDAASYVRFADGTQIASGTLSETLTLGTALAGGFSATGTATTFAAPFASAPAVTFTVTSGGALVQGADITATTAAPRLWSALAGSVTAELTYLAMGRWR